MIEDLTKEIADLLERNKKQTEILWTLYHHHASQSKDGVPPVRKEYNKKLAQEIKAVLN